MLYTGKGDKGDTGLFGSKDRISKGSFISEALGTLDELNSFVGLCKVKAEQVSVEGVSVKGARVQHYSIEAVLDEVQQNLFIIQAELAGAEKKIGKSKVEKMEKIIHAIEREIPPLTSFTVAGGTELAALVDVARTLARRAERRVVGVQDMEDRRISAQTLAYLNRLSSLLFALARLINLRSGITEESPDYR